MAAAAKKFKAVEIETKKENNIFKKAQSKAKPAAKKKTTKATDAMQLTGLQDLAAVSSLIKSLTTIQATLSEEIKEEVNNVFVNEGRKGRGKPDNFSAVDQESTSSCQLRKRTSTSKLTEEEIKLLNEYEISIEEHEAEDTIYLVNKEYMHDEVLLQRVSKALTNVKGIPEDFIEMREGSKYSTTSAKSINDVFEWGDDISEKDTRRLLEMVSTLALKPTYTGSMEDAMEFLKELI